MMRVWPLSSYVAVLLTASMAIPTIASAARITVHTSERQATPVLANTSQYRGVYTGYDHNYERYRRDCAEYLSKYGTGKSCQFPSGFPRTQVTVVQNKYTGQGYSGRYVNSEPVWVVNVNREQPTTSGFRIINTAQQDLPAGWSKHLRRGDILSPAIYELGRVTYRSPRGVVRIRIGDTTIQLQESDRKIMSVVNR